MAVENGGRRRSALARHTLSVFKAALEILWVQGEKAFVVLTFAHFRRSKKTRKGKSPGKGTPRAFLLFLLLPEFMFVAKCAALPSKKTRKGKSPGKGGTRFWKSIVLGFKTPREAIEGMSLLYVNDENPLFNGQEAIKVFNEMEQENLPESEVIFLRWLTKEETGINETLGLIRILVVDLKRANKAALTLVNF
ncbi:hypothetical protein HKD37_18G050317 [Glycine soja]